MAPVDRPYSGPDLLVAIQGASMIYGEMHIFHHFVKGYRRSVFSMANIIEPGTFNPPVMDDFFSPGLTFFMRLPGQLKGPQALDQMLKSIQHLATELGGQLCDQHRCPLDKQAIAMLRHDVMEHQQRLDDNTQYYSLTPPVNESENKAESETGAESETRAGAESENNES
jgi:cell division protein ZipA